MAEQAAGHLPSLRSPGPKPGYFRGRLSNPVWYLRPCPCPPPPLAPPANKQAALSLGQGCGWGLGTGAASPQPQRLLWGVYPLVLPPAPAQRPPHCPCSELMGLLPCGLVGKDQGRWGWFLCGISRPSGLRHKSGSEGAGRHPRACPGVAVLASVPCEHPWGHLTHHQCPGNALPGSLQPDASQRLPWEPQGQTHSPGAMSQPHHPLSSAQGTPPLPHLLLPPLQPLAKTTGRTWPQRPVLTLGGTPKMLSQAWISPSRTLSWGFGRLGPGESLCSRGSRRPRLWAVFLILP